MSTNSGHSGYGANVRAWYALSLLVALYCLSFIDRTVLALLAAPVMVSLHLSDTGLSLLLGVAFGGLYALVGLPIAHGLDRSNRIRIITAGVVLWSLCTIGSGFAANFIELFVLRSGVAIGEAVLTPAAISLIGDMFAVDRLTLPTAAYTSVSSFMSTGAFVAGGATLALATTISPFWGMAPWRVTLVLVGLPSLVIAAVLILTVREPKRRQATTIPGLSTRFSASDAWLYVSRRPQLYGALFVAMASYTIMSYGFLSWTTTFMVRAFGETPAHAGLGFGTAGLIAGVCGAALWPIAARWWTKKGNPDAIVIIFAAGLLLAMTSAVIIGLAPTASVALLGTALLVFTGSTAGVLPPLIIQYITPGTLRARMMAANLLASNLIGLGVGPTLVAALAQDLFSGPRSLGSAIALVAAALGPICVGAMLVARRAYLAAVDEVIE